MSSHLFWQYVKIGCLRRISNGFYANAYCDTSKVVAYGTLTKIYTKSDNSPKTNNPACKETEKQSILLYSDYFLNE